jgi:hypothetical protein
MPENATQEDVIAADSLMIEYIDKLNVIQDEEVNKVEAITKLVDETYIKYFQYSDVRKQVFRELILAYGTEACVEEENGNDLTTYQFTMGAWDFVRLLVYTAERDKNQGPFDAHSEIEYAKQFNATMRCPREMIRFFHRRNSCDCLHEIYYKLKDTTQRTTFCWNCRQLLDVKKALRCGCGIAKYCSNKCALDYWPRHKENCREVKSWFDIYVDLDFSITMLERNLNGTTT